MTTFAEASPRRAHRVDGGADGGADAWGGRRLPLHDARRIPDGKVLEYDVCIVGSGAAGCTAALSLAGRGLRVVVLESGGPVRDDTTGAFNALDCAIDEFDDESRGRWFGGTTNLWTGGLTTLDPIDLRPRSWMPDSGWPMSEERLRSCYERAAEMYGWPSPEVYDAPAVDASDCDGVRFDDESLRTTVFHQLATPLRFGEELLARLRVDSGVQVITLANVTSIDLDEAGVGVAGVTVETLVGGRLTVRSNTVLLACGAVENARLLLASRSRRPPGLGNARDVVGRYLQDHPKGFTGTVSMTDPTAPLPARPYWPTRQRRAGRTRWGVGLSAAAQERLGATNTYVRLEPDVVDRVPEGIRALRLAARGRVRKVDPRAIANLPSERDRLRRMARFRLRNEGPIERIEVRTFVEQAPDRSNRVRLSERRDPLGHPLAAVDWTLTDLDLHSVRMVHGVLGEALRDRGVGTLVADLDDAPIREAMGDASHHAGTTRMGRDPSTSVTDERGQVHDVPGLFVAGASLFPTSGYANPVFTIVATTLHVTDHLVEHADPPPVAVRAPARSHVTDVGKVETKRWLGARARARRPLPSAVRAAAVVWPGPGRADLVPIEVPRPGPGQVMVSVDVGAVSAGTERARWLGLPGASIRYPHHPGYSLSGRIEAVGPGVYDLAPGERVAVWGAPHQSVVTVRRRQVHPVDERIDLDSASMITLGAISAFGVARAGDPAGCSLAVIGAGAIGLLAQRLAISAGAANATVVAASDAKDAVVRGGRGVAVGLPADVDTLAADIVIEATGAGAGLDLALRAAAPGGVVVLLGTTRAESVPFALDLLTDRRLRLVGAHAGLLDAPGGTDGLDRVSAAQHFLDAVASGAVRVDDLVTSHVDPLDVADMYERLATDRAGVVPLIDWWRLAPDLRLRERPLVVPRPSRRGLVSPTGAAGSADPVPAVVEHAPAPERALDAGAPAVADAERAVVRLADAAPRSTVVVEGPAAVVDVDVQTLVHRRGTTVVGVPADASRGGS